MERLLVADCDGLVRAWFQQCLRQANLEVQTVSTSTELLAEFQTHSFSVVIVDNAFPDVRGPALLDKLRKIDPRVPLILMAIAGNSETAIEAMGKGAYHYLLKPLDRVEVEAVVQRALEASRMMRAAQVIPVQRGEHADKVEPLVGNCPAMQETYRQIGRVASKDVTVLILGESGTGKEVAARAVYRHSQRANRPYLAINCAAIPESLLESELFGHEKGAFTGADRTRIGRFEQCDGGTLFLDEIGDMTPLMQTKVLRVLQDQQFERVGGTTPIRTNVRLIAATNRNLTEMMKEGTFRSDLYFRLNAYTISLAPLRNRIGDLPLLVSHFLHHFSSARNKSVRAVSEEAMRLLSEYSWPGNIRELQGVLKYAIIESTGPVILPEFLPDSIQHAIRPRPFSISATQSSEDPLVQFIQQRLHAGTESLYDEIVQPLERQMFMELLKQVRGNMSRAAEVLGIARSTVRTKLTALKVDPERLISSKSKSRFR